MKNVSPRVTDQLKAEMCSNSPTRNKYWTPAVLSRSLVVRTQGEWNFRCNHDQDNRATGSRAGRNIGRDRRARAIEAGRQSEPEIYFFGYPGRHCRGR